jgi:hypothetical protein
MKIELVVGKFRFTVHFRSLTWLFRKGWYSLHRWKNPNDDYGELVKIIDCGIFSFVFAKRTDEWSY